MQRLGTGPTSGPSCVRSRWPETPSAGPRDISEDQAQAAWRLPPPNVTLVLRDQAGPLVGTATLHPNHDGPAAHVANATFAVDPQCRGRAVGRRLAEDTLARARAEGYRAMQFKHGSGNTALLSRLVRCI